MRSSVKSLNMRTLQIHSTTREMSTFFMLSFFFTVLPKAVGLALHTVREQADGCPEVLALCFLHKSKLTMNVYKEPWYSWHKK